MISHNEPSPTAPVSHQKRRHQNGTDAIERGQNRCKINEADRYSPAVCTENLIRVDEVMESPKLAE
jgi:hypothetical protein